VKQKVRFLRHSGLVSVFSRNLCGVFLLLDLGVAALCCCCAPARLEFAQAFRGRNLFFDLPKQIAPVCRDQRLFAGRRESPHLAFTRRNSYLSRRLITFLLNGLDAVPWYLECFLENLAFFDYNVLYLALLVSLHAGDGGRTHILFTQVTPGGFHAHARLDILYMVFPLLCHTSCFPS
jgi:hypothetical protein